MTDADQTAQIRVQSLAACDELVFVACELPSGCVARLAIIGLAENLRKEYNLTDAEKREIVLQRLDRVQPVAKNEFPDFLDFSRAESKRLIESVITAGLVEQFQGDSENGRPPILLRLP